MVCLRSFLTASFVLASATAVFASPIARQDLSSRDAPEGLGKRQGGCTTRLQRRAWQALSDAEKRAYIDAELCLMWRVPQRTGLEAAVSRFDDLVKAHQLQANVVHGDGWFLPFHRLHMHAHERLLREECGYTGAQPYWDEEADAGAFSSSVVFDAETGFGGNGVGADGCIQTGPFANYTLHTGPSFENVDHCISRAIDDDASRGSATDAVESCLALPDFATAWPCMEGAPHLGGHNGVGGEMSNPISSPGDPLFYLHHTFLDRVWWRWQQQNLPARLSDIAGYTTQEPPAGGWINATLDDELNMYGVIPNALIREVMDVTGDLLCMEYV